LAGGTDFVVIDDRIADEVICPASCATATVASAMRVTGDVSGATVIILGAGMLGLTAAAMAVSMDAASVTVCDVNPHRLELAKQFGCDNVVEFENVTGQYDVVFEMSGSGAATQATLQLASVGGAIVFVGSVLPSDSIAVDPEHVVRRLLSIHGVHNYAPQDLVAAVDFLAEQGEKYPFASLVARTFSLTEVNEAMEFGGAEQPIRMLIRP